MTGLPSLVQRAPGILYGLAVLFFLASLGLALIEINNTATHVEPGNPIVRQAVLRAVYQAALEAAYLAANGVVVHVLLAIWRNGAARQTGGGE
jgi:hypothetical protein